nr:uncharacterized protein LOC111107294 isoform X2 [Crassostrea virginica]
MNLGRSVIGRLDCLSICAIISIYLYSMVYVVDAMETVTYEFGSNCTSRSSDAYYRGYVNETRQFMVSYRGRTLKYYCSSISFHGSGTGENRRDKYKVCVTLKEFTDPDCALRLNFTNNLFGPILQTFDCVNSSDTKFCSGDDSNLYFELEVLDGKTPYLTRFRMLVTAEKVYKYEESNDAMVYGIAGAVGGTAAIVLIGGIAELVKRRFKKQRNRRHY